MKIHVYNCLRQIKVVSLLLLKLMHVAFYEAHPWKAESNLKLESKKNKTVALSDVLNVFFFYRRLASNAIAFLPESVFGNLVKLREL